MELEKLSLFQELTEEQIWQSMVCSQARVEHFDKNAYIFRQEDKPARLYFVLSGTVLLGQVNAAGRQNYVEYVNEGQGFGEVDLFLEHEEYRYFAEAKSEVTVLAVSRHFFYGTCAKNCSHHHKIIFNLLRIFAKEADRNNRKLHLLTSGNLRQRIAGYLMERCDENRIVELTMKREELAAYLNTTRPSLSRELSWMREAGVIEVISRSRIRIVSYEDLQNIIDGEGA